MSLHVYSRYTFCEVLRTDEGALFLSMREPYRYRDLPDNRVHTVTGGQSLDHIADKYFHPLPRAAGLWWIIADFQPEPMYDPTLLLSPGTELIIPSVRTVVELIFSEARRKEA